MLIFWGRRWVQVYRGREGDTLGEARAASSPPAVLQLRRRSHRGDHKLQSQTSSPIFPHFHPTARPLLSPSLSAVRFLEGRLGSSVSACAVSDEAHIECASLLDTPLLRLNTFAITQNLIASVSSSPGRLKVSDE